MDPVRPAALSAGVPASVRWLWLWGPVVAYMALIFYQSSLSNPSLPSSLSDKVVHLAAYGVLAGLVVRALLGGFPRPVTWRAAVLAVLITVLYGASDEWHQSFVPRRAADVMDLVADGAGALLAVVAAWGCGILWPRILSSQDAPRDL